MRLLADPQLVAEHHTVYVVRPLSVEFWQGDRERRHIRLRYRQADHGTANGWLTEHLWP